MPSQPTLIWVGAAGAALVVVGAAAGALVWTRPDFVWPNRGGTPVEEARAPAPTVPPTPLAGQAATPASGSEQTAAAPKGSEPADQAAEASAAAPSSANPSFDVVTVQPTGEAVIAGRAAPNAKVELKDAGKTVAEATADASGQFVMIPPTLAPGDHSLSLAAGEGGSETSKAVAVSVPLPEAKAAVAPPTVASPPPPPAVAMRTLATSPATDASRVAIQSVQGDAAGGLVARGSAEPNSVVRLYLNGADLADARTQSDGRWSLTIKHGVAPGAYAVRAEQVNPGGETVVASAEMRFDYPAAPPAGAASPPATAPEPAKPSPADVVLDSVQTAQVVSGHTLWALSQSYYGDPTRYPLIYEANKAQIHNPNLIFPGQVFVVPKFVAKP
jgi:nucleoid-associated protein YgaU